MPELPAVEYSRRLLHENCVGATIASLELADDPIVYKKVPVEHFQRKLTGKKIVGSGRYGKYLWLELEAETYLLIHLGMTGFVQVEGQDRLFYKSSPISPPDGNMIAKGDSTWPPRFTRMEAGLVYPDGLMTRFVFGDPRRLGRVQLLGQDPRTVSPVADLGFDPLLNMPPLSRFAAKLGSRRVLVKALLLDQSFSAGVGNWMADEILYYARIHPATPTQALTEESVQKLHWAISYVTKTAVVANADANQFPADWLFHVRWSRNKKGVTTKEGAKVAFETIAGRATAYVPVLQKKQTIAAL